jgi:hypothetical protein
LKQVIGQELNRVGRSFLGNFAQALEHYGNDGLVQVGPDGQSLDSSLLSGILVLLGSGGWVFFLL